MRGFVARWWYFVVCGRRGGYLLFKGRVFFFRGFYAVGEFWEGVRFFLGFVCG